MEAIRATLLWVEGRCLISGINWQWRSCISPRLAWVQKGSQTLDLVGIKAQSRLSSSDLSPAGFPVCVDGMDGVHQGPDTKEGGVEGNDICLVFSLGNELPSAEQFTVYKTLWPFIIPFNPSSPLGGGAYVPFIQGHTYRLGWDSVLGFLSPSPMLFPHFHSSVWGGMQCSAMGVTQVFRWEGYYW